MKKSTSSKMRVGAAALAVAVLLAVYLWAALRPRMRCRPYVSASAVRTAPATAKKLRNG